ncbi:neural proliferation differentiation and control protein 1 [Anopheles cruzii]|uniref:neural proliferation differentiation and control protein 1 n=1 Tax=Anopheles cruzii TaxID=68878 RepID=UPI0022EC7F0A|nr:neural proliferation differentiation and control protein 1 [Anopheles cruzii]XP_052868584.1 neural proliferation differentiation and control protein 1 [Anopheles cruzii]
MTFSRVRLSFLTIWNIFLILPMATTDNDYISGYRRRLHPMSPVSWTPKDGHDTADNLVKTINILIEQQARRRFLEHLQRLHTPGSKSIPVPSYRGPDEISEEYRPTYTYQLPFNNQIDSGEPINFAVGPSDPRFYDQSDGSLFYDSSSEPLGAGADDGMKALASEGEDTLGEEPIQEYRHPPPPPPIRAKVGKGLHHTRNLTGSAGNGPLNRSSNSNGVVQQPIELGNGLGMYLIALIAGVSAAISAALISIGFGWYSLHKRTKAAADVEYPAYGVTGPNRDSSPAVAGDRKLAQNAQMYHYQHQKQQIIAMENTTRSSIHSELPSEDENEEGDYTVYECPGLAPTGEMEVKNPLFLEEGPVSGAPLQSSNPDDGPAAGMKYIEKAVQPQSHNSKKSGT